MNKFFFIIKVANENTLRVNMWTMSRWWNADNLRIILISEDSESRPTLLLAVQVYTPESSTPGSLIVRDELSLLSITSSLKPESFPWIFQLTAGAGTIAAIQRTVIWVSEMTVSLDPTYISTSGSSSSMKRRSLVPCFMRGGSRSLTRWKGKEKRSPLLTHGNVAN